MSRWVTCRLLQGSQRPREAGRSGKRGRETHTLAGWLPEAHGTERHAFYPVRHRERVDPDRVFCCRCRPAIPSVPSHRTLSSPRRSEQRQGGWGQLLVAHQDDERTSCPLPLPARPPSLRQGSIISYQGITLEPACIHSTTRRCCRQRSFLSSYPIPSRPVLRFRLNLSAS